MPAEYSEEMDRSNRPDMYFRRVQGGKIGGGASNWPDKKPYLPHEQVGGEMSCPYDKKPYLTPEEIRQKRIERTENLQAESDERERAFFADKYRELESRRQDRSDYNEQIGIDEQDRMAERLSSLPDSPRLRPGHDYRRPDYSDERSRIADTYVENMRRADDKMAARFAEEFESDRYQRAVDDFDSAFADVLEEYDDERPDKYGRGGYEDPSDQDFAGRYPVIYDRERNYPKNDTHTDVLFGSSMGQDYDNDGVPYAFENPGYVRADQYRIVDSASTPDHDEYLTPSAVRSPEIYRGPVHTQGTRLNNNYNDVIYNDTLGQDYDDDGLPYAVDTGDDALSRNYDIDFRVGGDIRSERLQELRSSIRNSMGSGNTPDHDEYLNSAAVRSPEIYRGPVHTQGTRLNNNYNDVIYNDTLGQDYDDDGLPYAVDTGDDALSRNYDIDFRVGGDIRSERLQALRNSMRDSMSADAADQAFDYARYNSGSGYENSNPFDGITNGSVGYPRIYDEHDKSGYPEDDTVTDIVFGDVVGQDYDNDGVPYAVETPDRPVQNYASIFETNDDLNYDKIHSNGSKYMTNNYGMDYKKKSVFEGENREEAINNIRRNLGNRFRDSDNDSIASEIARNRLSKRMEQSENAEQSARRARILEDSKAFGRGRMMSGRRGSRNRVDDYVMGDYEPSPAAMLAGNHDYEGTLLSSGVAARAMGRA